jgi:hypothetical protein
MDPILHQLPASLPNGALPTVVNPAKATQPSSPKSSILPNQDKPLNLQADGWDALAAIYKDSANDPFNIRGISGLQQRDERRATRSAVPKEKQPCEIKFKSTVLPATILDVSSYGFSILLDRLEGLKVGKKAHLHTKMGRYLIKVVYINSVAPPDGAPPGSDTWLRLGLKKARSFMLF